MAWKMLEYTLQFCKNIFVLLFLTKILRWLPVQENSPNKSQQIPSNGGTVLSQKFFLCPVFPLCFGQICLKKTYDYNRSPSSIWWYIIYASILQYCQNMKSAFIIIIMIIIISTVRCSYNRYIQRSNPIPSLPTIPTTYSFECSIPFNGDLKHSKMWSETF